MFYKDKKKRNSKRVKRVNQASSRDWLSRFSRAHEIYTSCQTRTYATQKREKLSKMQLRSQLAWSGWCPTGSCRPGQTQPFSSETQLFYY